MSLISIRNVVRAAPVHYEVRSQRGKHSSGSDVFSTVMICCVRDRFACLGETAEATHVGLLYSY